VGRRAKDFLLSVQTCWVIQPRTVIAGVPVGTYGYHRGLHSLNFSVVNADIRSEIRLRDATKAGQVASRNGEEGQARYYHG